MKDLEKRFDCVMAELLAPLGGGAPSPLVAGVSGGEDSMTLLRLLSDCPSKPQVIVAHCNFSLRGEESDGDARLVRATAAEYGFPYEEAVFDTAAFASSHGISVEMAARQLRYGFFASLCRKYGSRVTVVAHHADDNAETLMLILLRGTGGKGLSAMAECSPLPCDGGEGLFLIRPLLGFTKAEIHSFAAEKGVKFRVDSTNSGTEYRRNFIRNKVFPLLSELNPSFVETFSRDIAHAAQLERVASDWADERTKEVWDGEVIDVKKLTANPHWEYLLFRILSSEGLGENAIDRIRGMILSGRRGKALQCGDIRWEYSGSAVRKTAASPAAPDVLVSGDGAWSVGSTRFTVETITVDGGFKRPQPSGVSVMDASALTFPFVAGRWRRGDWMVPTGLRGKKKLSDLFKDLKYSSVEKGNALIIRKAASESRVAAVAGVRTDSSCAVGDRTVKAVRIVLETSI